MFARFALGGMFFAALSAAVPAAAQQVGVGGPLSGVSSGYFEQFGVGFGLQGPGMFFQMNNPAVPPFGGFQPGAGAQFGFAGPNGFLNISAAQGSTSSLRTTSGSLTLQNGIPGSIFAGSVEPFVISVIPVVGDEAPDRGVLRERLERLRSEPPRRRGAPAASAPVSAPNAPSRAAARDDFTRRLKESGSGAAGPPTESVAEIRRRLAAERAENPRRAQR